MTLALAGLGALGVLVLAPTLTAGFEYDDRADVLDNPAARPETFLATIGATNRPLVKASYAVQRLVTGAAPQPYHALNLALHLATAIVVFFLLRRWTSGAGAPHRDLVAWLTAALWALHPAAVEAVAPIVGRSTLLSSLLLLVALLLATGERPPSGRRALGIGLAATAAGLARETALVLPALGLFWQATLGRDEKRASALRRQLPLAAGTAVAAIGVALSARHRELIEFSLETRGPLAALRGNVIAVLDMGLLWLRPSRLSIDPAQPADLPWTAPATLAAAALLAGAAVAALALRRRLPRVAFGVGWTLLALAPSNSIVWRLDPVAPRALYLASVGVVLLFALAAASAARALAQRPAHGAALAAASTLLAVWPLAAEARETRRRAELWAEPAALWADAARKAPEKARPWLNLGVELMLAGQLEAAEAALERAARLDPNRSNARCALDALRVRMAAVDGRERSVLR